MKNEPLTRMWFAKDKILIITNLNGSEPSIKKWLCVWWDFRGIIYHVLPKSNLTIIAERKV